MSEQEQVVIKYNKYSMWTMVKVTVYNCFVAVMLSLFAFLFVKMDISLAQALGLLERAYHYCGG